MAIEFSPLTDGKQVNISNWMSAPFNRWAFHNTGQLLPCDKIANASDNVLQLPAKHSSSLEDFCIKVENGADIGLIQFLKETNTDGLVVLQDGQLVYEFYDNGMTAHSQHILMSASKSVIGLIAGILQGKGILNTDALVSDYVPEIASSAYRGATVRNLMDMQAGIVFDKNQLRAYEAAVGWNPMEKGEEHLGLHDFFEKTTGPSIPHGGPFSYVSPNTDLLGWVIERAAGQPFAPLVSTLLWKPMGAENGACINVDRKGVPQCTRGLCATTRDFARIGQLMLQDGRRENLEIIPSSWLNDIAANGNSDAWKKGEFAQAFAGFNMNYRSGWYVVENEPKYQFAMGIYGQNLFVDRTNHLVIAKVSSQASPLDYRSIALTHKAFAAIRQCLIM